MLVETGNDCTKRDFFIAKSSVIIIIVKEETFVRNKIVHVCMTK